MYNIAIISGDGIGKEVMSGCEYLLDKLDLEFSFEYGEAGFECFNKNGTTLPEETIKIANKSDAVLFGASTSTPGQPSPIINLRKALNVYANIRPIKSYKGVNCIRDDIDFVIVRENTEGLYSQVEYGDENKMIAERHITRKAYPREYQKQHSIYASRGESKVTCVHKSNVLKKTDTVFKESFYNVAKNYPQIQTEDFYVDATAMYLITQPQNSMSSYQPIYSETYFPMKAQVWSEALALHHQGISETTTDCSNLFTDPHLTLQENTLQTLVQ